MFSTSYLCIALRLSYFNQHCQKLLSQKKSRNSRILIFGIRPTPTLSLSWPAAAAAPPSLSLYLGQGKMVERGPPAGPKLKTRNNLIRIFQSRVKITWSIRLLQTKEQNGVPTPTTTNFQSIALCCAQAAVYMLVLFSKLGFVAIFSAICVTIFFAIELVSELREWTTNCVQDTRNKHAI